MDGGHRKRCVQEGRGVATLALAVGALSISAEALAQQGQSPPVPEPPILFRAGGAIETTFTDNVDPGQPVKDSDLLGTATATAVLQGRTRRGEINGTLNLSYDYYTHNTRLNGARYDGLLNTRADLIEDVVDVSAQVGATLQSTSSQGAEAATDRLIGANQTQVINSSLNPRYRTRVADFAEATVTYALASVVYEQPSTATAPPPSSDSVSNEGQIDLRSGPEFEMIQWSVSALARELRRVGTLPLQSPTDDRTSMRRNAQSSLEYEVSPQFRFIATGGVDDIDEPSLISPPDGGFGTAGFAWQPSERTSFRINGGYRYGGPTLDADVTYQPREWLRLGLTVSESVETQQSLLNQQLNGVTRDENGILIDPVTGGEPTPNQNPFDLTDQAFRQNRVQLSLGGQFQRTTYTITGAYDQRDSDQVGSNSWTGQATVGRQLSLNLDVTLSGRYNRIAQGGLVTQITETYGGAFNVNYRLGPTAFLTSTYSYLKRVSPQIRTQENALVVSLARRF